MAEYEITSFEQASEDLLNISREVLKVISQHYATHDLPRHTVLTLFALRDAVWEMEKWE